MYKPIAEERRNSQRMTVSLVVGETTGGKYFLPQVTNLGVDGACIDSPSGLERPRAHFLVLEMMLPGCDEIIWARCRVVREEKRGFFRRQAVRFVNISAVHRNMLRMYLQRCIGRA